jgi:PAS domain S-box-containing protein
MTSSTDREISCRVTHALLMYLREQNHGSLGNLLEGLELNEAYLLDQNNWVSHAFLHILYHRMIAILGDEDCVYKFALSSGRFESLGLLDSLARLLGSPRLIYSQAPKYNRMLKLNGDVYIHELGDSWVVLEDRYHCSAQKTRYDCDYTRGIITGIPTVFNLPLAEVEEIECQVDPATYGRRTWPDTPVHGAAGCLYRVRWDRRKKHSLGRRAVQKAVENLQDANRRIQDKYDEVRRLASDLEEANARLLASKQQLESYAADLQSSEERYRFLAENVSDIIWTLSLETMRFTYVSPSVSMIRGITAEEALQLSLEDALAPESFEAIQRALEEELARDSQAGVDRGRHRTVELRQRCKDGTYQWAEATVGFIRNEEGRPIGLLGVTRDIEERKRGEEMSRRSHEELRRSHEEAERRLEERKAEVRASHERFRALVELLPEIVFETDIHEKYTYANRQALEAFRLTPEEFQRGLCMRDVVVEKDYARILENGRRILQGEVRQGGEYTVRRNDGTEFPAFIRASRIEHNGDTIGLRGIVVDLTESRRAEAERTSLEEQLRQSQKMEAVGTLAGGIAHDFNNMLAVIIGNAELALDEVGDSMQGIGYQLDQILKASKRASDLVKRILTFSRKTQGHKKPMELAPLVKETVDLLRGSLLNTVEIKLDVIAEHATVLADQSQVEQVLINLATNAAHAMREEGGVLTITLSTVTLTEKGPKPVPDLRPGRYAVLTVTDTGSGIPQSIRERIFDPFFTTKETGQGTGMGLAVVFGIVRGHGGAITVQSEVGRGSTFTVLLPSLSGVVDEERAGRATPAEREKVLVVDDEAAVLNVVARTLMRLGYRVVMAESGAEAWEKFQEAPGTFDLVLTDHIMPSLTGLKLSEKILALRPDIPIVLFTGYTETVSPQKAKAAGIREFITKPIGTRELTEIVRRVLDSRN